MSQKVIKELTNKILEARQDSPFRVGIDGVDAAGKTFLADEIASYLVERGSKHILIPAVKPHCWVLAEEALT
jgi:pantothenate kinase-related protein Tda10